MQMRIASLRDTFGFDFNLKLHKNLNHYCTVEFHLFPEWLSIFVFSLAAKSNNITVAVVGKDLLLCFYLWTLRTPFSLFIHFLYINATQEDGILCLFMYYYEQKVRGFKAYNNFNSNMSSEESISRKETNSKSEH